MTGRRGPGGLRAARVAFAAAGVVLLPGCRLGLFTHLATDEEAEPPEIPLEGPPEPDPAALPEPR